MPNKKLISISVYGDQFEPVLLKVLLPFISNHQQLFSKFIFNRSTERGNNLVLIFEVDKDTSATDQINALLKHDLQQYLQAYPFALKDIHPPVADWFLPFQNNHIEFNSNFLFDIMETGGLKASFLAQDLLSHSSTMLMEIFDQSEVWDPESSLGVAIQIQTALVCAFLKNEEKIHEFYNWSFSNLMKKVNNITNEQRVELLNGLEGMFSEQGESITEFISYFTQQFLSNETTDEVWIDEWNLTCTHISRSLFDLHNNHMYFLPESFQAETKGDSTQELWPVLEYYVRAINSQMGVTNSLELNLMYLLMRSSEALADQAKSFSK